MTCKREQLGRSPRWCRHHLRKGAPSMLWGLGLLWSGSVWTAFASSAWLNTYGWAPGLLLVVGLTILPSSLLSQNLKLDLPPMPWRLQARRDQAVSHRISRVLYNPERGDKECIWTLKCPGCGDEGSWPEERELFRCQGVEYELRGYDIWIAPAPEPPRAARAPKSGSAAGATTVPPASPNGGPWN